MEVQVGADGRVARTNVLQAPDEAIAASVTAALQHWTFHPTTISGSDRPVEVVGKLTFYFIITAGAGKVLSPAEMLQANRETARGTGSITEIKEPDLPAALKKPNSCVLDIQDRSGFSSSHRPSAINIPYDEFVSRARNELKNRSHIIIDCTTVTSSLCRIAGRELQGAGFDVSLLFR